MEFYYYKADIIRVKDGDTVEALVDSGFRGYQLDSFRLTKFNAPETTWRASSKAEKDHGIEATKFLEDSIRFSGNPSKPATLLQKLGTPIIGSAIIKSAKHGKYRWLAEVFHWTDRDLDLGSGQIKSINDEMIDAGFEKQMTYPSDMED